MCDLIIEVLFGDYFYDDALDSHSSDIRAFVKKLITDSIWPRYRCIVTHKIQHIVKLEERAAEH